VQDIVSPGDVVEVDGNAIYPGGIHFRRHGRADAPITIRGVLVKGVPPVLAGGDEYTIVLHGDHYLLETCQITQGAEYCVVHKADDITLRDVVVHDCPKHGILGTDEESGSLTISHSEVFGCGIDEKKHQLYIATDETMHPGSVFRLEFSYVHGAKGGNNVKSRSERNEIYYNWIEGAAYHGLDLIGPDGQNENIAREDSDVVGNVVITTSSWQIARFGGDGTGGTRGRFRFVNNTFIVGPDATIALRMQERVESVELHNNVFIKLGSKEVQLVRHSDPMGPEPVIRGSNNWVHNGFVDVPEHLSGTLRGDSPKFANLNTLDLTPSIDSPLLGSATTSTVVDDEHPMPNPLNVPGFIPPFRMRLSPGTQIARPTDALDIGAFQYGLPKAPKPKWGPRTVDPIQSQRPGRDRDGAYGACECDLGKPAQQPPWSLLAILGFALSARITSRRLQTQRLQSQRLQTQRLQTQRLR
jgi:hypothetical protein